MTTPVSDPRNATLAPLAIAAGTGMVLWYAAVLTTGRREAWDAPEYWWLAYPMALLACAGLGIRWPRRAWLWALVLFEAQFVAMALRNGPGNLWPLGMALVAVVAVPGIALAMLGARWRRNNDAAA